MVYTSFIIIQMTDTSPPDSTSYFDVLIVKNTGHKPFFVYLEIRPVPRFDWLKLIDEIAPRRRMEESDWKYTMIISREKKPLANHNKLVEMSSQEIIPCVIVHGGAFNIPDSYIERYRDGTQAAAKAGYQCLLKVKNKKDFNFWEKKLPNAVSC